MLEKAALYNSMKDDGNEPLILGEQGRENGQVLPDVEELPPMFLDGIPPQPRLQRQHGTYGTRAGETVANNGAFNNRRGMRRFGPGNGNPYSNGNGRRVQ